MAQNLVINKGLHELGNFVHVLLPPVAGSVSRLFTMIGDSALLHEIDALGHVVTSVVDIPQAKAIVALLDELERLQSAASATPTVAATL